MTALAAQLSRRPDIFTPAYDYDIAENARRAGLYPYGRPLEGNEGTEAVIDGRQVLMFGSNNYLGLTSYAPVREAAARALERYGTSMTGSRLINGSTRLHEQLELELADFVGKDAAMVCTTGYQANLATLGALLRGRHVVAVVDRKVHASLYEGVGLGKAMGARMRRYHHANPIDLHRALSELPNGSAALVVTDGVFSAEGDLAPLDEIVEVCGHHGARLFVDDAHGLGVVGPDGRGTAHAYGVADRVDLIGGTFSKALASVGGWVAGDGRVIDYLRHRGSAYVFSASAPPSAVAAALASLRVLRSERWRVPALQENFRYLSSALREMGFEVGPTQSAVVPIYVRDDARTLAMWRDLLEVHNIYVNPFISPSVPVGGAVLRTSTMATHTREQLDRGLAAFYEVGRNHGLID